MGKVQNILFKDIVIISEERKKFHSALNVNMNVLVMSAHVACWNVFDRSVQDVFKY